MLHKLINLNADLKRFWDEGYEVEIVDNHLVIGNIPFLDSSQTIQFGKLVSTLSLAGDSTLKPDTHVVFFVGETPCGRDGSPLSSIINASSTQHLTPNLSINHTFSSKPVDGQGYANYFEKMTTYINILSAPAKALDGKVTERTFNVVGLPMSESVFKYPDTNSALAKIGKIVDRLSSQRIAIVGLGGTGAYLLDLVSKTPVSEIHLFDGDLFKTNNAFRAPGAASLTDLRQRLYKTDYFFRLFKKMRRGIVSHPYFVDQSNIGELRDFDYVFLCLDNGLAKKVIVDHLLDAEATFIDVGMGIQNVDDKLIGAVRVTTSSANKHDHVSKRIPFETEIQNEYVTNIQIAELNALNAALAIIKWKKLSGIYHDFEHENHTTYTLEMNLLTGEDYDS